MARTQSKLFEMHKPTSLDNVTRSMIREMQVLGVRNSDIAEYLPQFFEELKNEVVQEQNQFYGRGKKVVG